MLTNVNFKDSHNSFLWTKTKQNKLKTKKQTDKQNKKVLKMILN